MIWMSRIGIFLIGLHLGLGPFGCANMGHNNVRKDWVKFEGGLHKDRSWEESLIFKRVSWYHGITMYFDALFYPANAKSPFALWFGETGLELMRTCDPLLVTAQYSADLRKISESDFKQQMEQNGFESVVLPEFSKALVTHPSYERWNFHHYDIVGYCRKSGFRESGKIVIHFPGFLNAYVDFESSLDDD